MFQKIKELGINFDEYAVMCFSIAQCVLVPDISNSNIVLENFNLSWRQET
jgi:hypothetical protein